MTTINIPTISLASITKAVDGNKTYITLAVGAAVIALNHFGLIPPQYAPTALDPNNWVADEYKLLVGAVFRSALKKGDTFNLGSLLKPGP